MIKRKFRVQPAGLDQFRAFLLALSLFHESSIDVKDLEAAGPILTLANGAEIRPFWIFPEDEPALRAIEDPLFPDKPKPEPAPLELVPQYRRRKLAGRRSFVTLHITSLNICKPSFTTANGVRMERDGLNGNGSHQRNLVQECRGAGRRN